MRIVVTGPESTGKSMLTAGLAEKLGLPFATEYARSYLEKYGPAYTYELLLDLSREHKAYQQRCVPDTAPLGIFDTDLINYKIWCEVAFGKCHPDIIRAMEAETQHVYLLCYPDLPWEFDPLREHKHERMMLFERHQAEIIRLNRPFAVVRGTGDNRLQNALAALKNAGVIS
jgi:nicotinamide riboside kinase